jgi:universal stress protein E
VHAFESVPIGSFAPEGMSPQLFQEWVDRRRATACSQFQRLMRGSHITKSRQYLLDAPPVTAITRVARQTKADIAVLGAVSRSGLKRLLIGSTAEVLLDRLSCDLLIVKPAQFKARVARAKAGVRVVPAASPVTL